MADASNPAGWYPMPDGSLRYWDGAQWTEHVDDTATTGSPTAGGTPPVPMSPAPGTSGPAPQKGLSPGAIVGLVLGGMVLLCGVGGLIALAAGVGTFDMTVEDGQSEIFTNAFGDVTLGEPQVDPGGLVTVPVIARNSGRDPATYLVEVVATNNDGSVEYESATALIEDVEPGDSAQSTAVFVAVPAASVFEVVRAQRYSDTQ